LTSPIYNLFIFCYRSALGLAAATGNDKAKKWISGRKNQFDKLKSELPAGEERWWFHCASLGEFEQGRPLIEQVRLIHPDKKIVLTFFSPSGYEVRKNYPGADYIYYLPLDSKSNAELFISLVKPEKVFFIKYEFWNFYLHELKRKKIPVYLVSGIFRPGQKFFRGKTGFFRSMLNCFDHFFVQDDQSAELLKKIGLVNTTVTGDTRFDRVAEISKNVKEDDLVDTFCEGMKVLIGGSTWEEDEKMIADIAEKYSGRMRFIIAPHEVDENVISALLQRFQSHHPLLYSQASHGNIHSAGVLIIDSVGKLSSIYQYASFAFIGGGFGKGIHNVLEAAVFGMPVFFGPNHKRFRESVELVEAGGGFSVHSTEEFQNLLADLFNDQARLAMVSEAACTYVLSRTGATEKITEELKNWVTK